MKVFKRKDNYSLSVVHVFFASNDTKSINDIKQPYFSVIADESEKTIRIYKPANWKLSHCDFKEFA